ncbi:MAG: PASTA domain-containing protein [Candidatus Syntrophosphaera sp.]|nr:PASTA domain-containing protein [Candidatus Syntrophosphaera sp.]
MRSRYLFLVFIFGLATLVWSIYLFSLQIFDPFNLANDRLVRYTPTKEQLTPTRGSIYDAKGDLLVSSISYYQIDIDRNAVSKWADGEGIGLNKAYDMISQAIGNNCSVKPEQVKKRLTMNDRLNSIQITNRVREMELERIIRAFSDEDLPGLIHSFSSMRRIYSRGIQAARLLGSVQALSDGYDPETGSKSLYQLRGINGIEATHDKYLAGEYGWREVVYDARHRRVPYPNLHEKPSQDGYNLHLTIDANIQEIVENALYEGLKKYRAKNAGAIAMDPNTGRIIAMAGVSASDNNIDPGLVRVQSNIPVSFMFEPGSTMKPLTMLPALEKNLIRPNEQIPCGTYQIGKRTIRDTHVYNTLRPVDIITRSSNVGIARIAERIGSKRLYEKFISLGYGQKTGLNLYGESSGIFAKLENWDGYMLHSLSFGQAISVTALQHATAFCAVANGGKIVKPYVLEYVTDSTGRVVERFEPEVLRQVSSKAATDTIRHYMQGVVDNGTARHIKMDYIKVAGKTGTAQKAMEDGRGYASGKYNSVFVGMFPADAPKVVLIVFYDEPMVGYHYGSLSAAPTFKKIVEDMLFMPNSNLIAFDERLIQSSLKMPDLRGKHINQAQAILNQYGFSYNIEGPDESSVVVDQFPKPNVSVDPSHLVTLRIGISAEQAEPVVVRGEMPDLCGLTLRRAMQVAARENIALKVKGSGIVRRQSIQPGSRVTNHATCVIEASL